MRRLRSGAILMLLGFGLSKDSTLWSAELPTVTSSLFSASGNCAFCHDQWAGALLDSSGRSVSITGDWRGTMMAHSYKDPLWQAVMEAEVAARPDLRDFIEDKCQTCHAPMARTQHHHDGNGRLSFAAAQVDDLASDGVSCTLCHQIQADGLGEAASFSGGYEIQETRQIFGPYEGVLTMPMRRHVAYIPQFGAHVQQSAFCGTCHTLYTPILGEDGALMGQFPEQTPYLEWLASDYPHRGTHCQDCHMPRLDEAIKVSARPPWLEGRQPFWRHQFVGGNSFMLRLMATASEVIQPHDEPGRMVDTAVLAEDQLRRAVRLGVTGSRAPEGVELTVRLENRTGHKFPTGHPYRRAWLQVLIKDQEGRLRFSSGVPDGEGALPGMARGYAPHYAEITEPAQVQVYESVMADAAGQRTYGLLAAVDYLKDNRIPPKGFPNDHPQPDVRVRGRAAEDPDFNVDAGGTDTVRYHCPLPETEGPLEAEVALLYQTVPPEAIGSLRQSDGPAARRFIRLYPSGSQTVTLVQSVSVRLD